MKILRWYAVLLAKSFRSLLVGLRTNQMLINAYLLLELAAKVPKSRSEFSKLKLFWRVRPYTMVSYKRLDNVYELATRVESEGLPGAFVECGVWRGGCSAVMAHVASKSRLTRKVWLIDSFEGLPEPTSIDGRFAREYSAGKASGVLSSIGMCVGSVSVVRSLLFKKLGLSEETVVIKKGWFQDVLPVLRRQVVPIVILRIDGDWYESTKCCLDELFDCVLPNGFVIIDDYGYWEGCKKAVDEFIRARNLRVDLVKIDDTGVYFRKS